MRASLCNSQAQYVRTSILVLCFCVTYFSDTSSARAPSSLLRISQPTSVDAKFNLTRQEAALLADAGLPLHALAARLSAAERLSEAQPRNGIPEGVQCETDTWCDHAGVCSTTCKRGSVRVDPWQAWAMQFQLSLSMHQPLCYSQALASHNSAITLADGYGNRDDLYSGYLKWLGTLGASHELQTNNQWLSMTDQLNLGVRFLEVDVHYVADELRIAHCGGLHSAQLDRVVALVNSVAKLLGRPELTWDVETLGCSPSLSSIPTKDQRTFDGAMAEVAAWLTATPNQQQLLLLFLDNQPNLAKWDKVTDMKEQILQHFPRDLILTPPEAAALMQQRQGQGQGPPSGQQLVQQGKRLLILSSTDYGPDMADLIFSTSGFATLCPYSEAWMEDFRYKPQDQDMAEAEPGAGEREEVPRSRVPDVDAAAANTATALLAAAGSSGSGSPRRGNQRGQVRDPSGSAEVESEVSFDSERETPEGLQHGDDGGNGDHARPGDGVCYLCRQDPRRHGLQSQHSPLFDGELVRMPACELRYGPLDCHFRLGGHNVGLAMGDPDVAQVTACGLNFPAPDRLTPDRAAAHIWAWAPDHPPTELLLADAARGRAGAAKAAAAADQFGCTFADALDGRWRAGPCTVNASQNTLGACRLAAAAGAPLPLLRDGSTGGASRLWHLAPLQDGAAAAQPQCPPGYVHDIPYTAAENLLLRQAQGVAGSSRALLPLKPPGYLPSWLQGQAGLGVGILVAGQS